MQAGVDAVGEKTQTVASVMQQVQGLKGQLNADGLNSLDAVIDRAERTQQATQGIMETIGVTDPLHALSKNNAEEYSTADFANLFIYLALVPVIFMRLRDIGLHSPVAMWSVAAGSYATIIADGLNMFHIYTIPFVPSAGMATLSFFCMMWLCTHKSADRTEHHRKNYMPGDSENDPY